VRICASLPLLHPPLTRLDPPRSWEFPTEAGAGNVATPADTTHFLLLLEEIRATKPGKELVLSAAVSVAPFDGPDGNPLADVSAFAAVLDFIGPRPSLLRVSRR
jgi:hypothetical protein